MKEKLCPIMNCNCIGEKCGWWDIWFETCAVNLISNLLETKEKPEVYGKKFHSQL